EKIRRLLPSVRPAVYAALDLSHEQLLRSTGRLALDYPWLEVVAVVGDYSAELESRLSLPAYARRIVFFPGSSIGNFQPEQAQGLRERTREVVGASGGVLIGVDLVKATPVLNRAYNDPEGYTATFNLNLLTRLNRELGADFDLSAFSHEAFYNAARSRIEMH